MLGITDSIDDMIDKALKLDFAAQKPLYGHKTSCIKLSKNELPDFDCLHMITNLYHAIESVKRERKPSIMNWSWPTRKEPATNNPSKEVCLERKLIGHEDWACQVPTASGLVDAYLDKRSAIDLVHLCEDDWYEFIELKVDSDTPIFAAMEILQYGLLYVLTRSNRKDWEYNPQDSPLLYANGVHLKVLAPDTYYTNDTTGTRYELGWFEKKLHHGLKEFLSQRTSDYDMTFSFESFTSQEQWLVDPARNRTRVYAINS